MPSYSEKLKDPRWQKLRLQVMERDQFECQLCDAVDKTLHVHHLVYSRNPWESPMENLVTVCEDCHTEIEFTLNEVRRISNWDVTLYAVKDALDLMNQHHPAHIGLILGLLRRNPAKVGEVWQLLVDDNWRRQGRGGSPPQFPL